MFHTEGPLLSARITLAQSSSVEFIVTTFYTGRVLFCRSSRIMLAHFLAIIIVKVHTVTTFPTGEPLLSAYIPKLFCQLLIGQLADTS